MQILIWGDKMRKQISVCIFFGGILCILMGFVLTMYISSAKRHQEAEISVTEKTEEPEIVISSKQMDPCKYVILAHEGMLVVYYSDYSTVYLDTGIQVMTLPDTVKDQLLQGIPFNSEEELFAFLESYSS